MKSIKIYACGMVLVLVTVLIVSCTKTFDEKINLQNNFNNSTLAQVFIATVGASRNTVYLDGNPITGALMVSGSLFPTTAHGFAAPPGLHSFIIKDTLRTSTQLPLTFSTNMQVGKYYSIFMYDTTTSPKQVTVPTTIVEIKDTTVRLRLANFVYSPNGLPAIDVYSFVRGTNIFTNIPTGGVTDFIPYPSRITDTLYFRETGTQTTLLKLTYVGGLVDRRHHTAVYRGSIPRGTYAGTRTVTTYLNY